MWVRNSSSIRAAVEPIHLECRALEDSDNEDGRKADLVADLVTR
jgi:hypothetical protein